MTTPTTFTIMFKHAAAKGPTFTTPQATAAALEDEYGKITMYDLLLHYKEGPSERVDAQMWLDDYRTARMVHDAPMPAFNREATQKQLQAALDRYYWRYDNTAYLAACHSLRLIEDQPEYIQQAIRIQDVALYLCGAQNLPCISPTRITREMVLFWMNFASDQRQDDDDNELPF